MNLIQKTMFTFSCTRSLLVAWGLCYSKERIFDVLHALYMFYFDQRINEALDLHYSQYVQAQKDKEYYEKNIKEKKIWKIYKIILKIKNKAKQKNKNRKELEF